MTLLVTHVNLPAPSESGQRVDLSCPLIYKAALEAVVLSDVSAKATVHPWVDPPVAVGTRSD